MEAQDVSIDIRTRVEAMMHNPAEISRRKKRIEALNQMPAAAELRKQMYSFAPLFLDMPLQLGYSYDEVVICPGVYSTGGAFSPADFQININTHTGKRCGPILLHEMLHLHIDFMSEDVSQKQLIEDLHGRLINALPILDEAYEGAEEVLNLINAEKPDPTDHSYLFF